MANIIFLFTIFCILGIIVSGVAHVHYHDICSGKEKVAERFLELFSILAVLGAGSLTFIG